MRVLRWMFGVAALAAVIAFLWALLAPRRKVEAQPTPTYVAPEPADDHEVSVDDAQPLPAGIVT